MDFSTPTTSNRMRRRPSLVDENRPSAKRGQKTPPDRRTKTPPHRLLHTNNARHTETQHRSTAISSPSITQHSSQQPTLPTELPHADFMVVRVEREEGIVPPLTNIRCVVVHGNEGADEQRLRAMAPTKTIELRGFWAQLPMRVGNKVRLFTAQLATPSTTITDGDAMSFLLVCPDTLVACTTVAGAVYCARKSVLNERFRGGCDAGNRVMILGTVVHCLFQAAVQAMRRRGAIDGKWLAHIAEECIAQDLQILEQLWALDWPLGEFLVECDKYSDNIVAWCAQFAGGRLPVVEQRAGNEQSHLYGAHFDGLRDIEENMWCNKFGIRGKIDITMRARTSSSQSTVVPIELKTGRSSGGADHMGQVLLYTLMLSSLNGEGEPGAVDGQLVYVKDNTVHTVRRTQSLLRGVLQLRNEMAFHIDHLEGTALPPPLNDERACGQCPQLVNCALWNEGREEGIHHFPIGQQAIAHLRRCDKEFLLDCVCDVLRALKHFVDKRPRNSNAWLMRDDMRESRGECFAQMRMSNVKVLPHSTVLSPAQAATFVKCNKSSLCPSPQLSLGAMLLVTSTTRRHTALFMGPIIHMDDASVTVALDRPARADIRSDVFRLDVYTSITSMQTVMGNLTRLALNTPHANQLRELIVPDGNSTKIASFAKTVPNHVLRVVKRCTPRHTPLPLLRAFVRILQARNFVLLRLGVDRRTSHLAQIVHVLMACQHSVLLVAHDNRTIDQVLAACQSIEGFATDSTLRLGSIKGVGDTSLHLHLSSRLSLLPVRQRYAAIATQYETASLVACTTSTSSNHLLFGRRRFDYSLVLSSSHMTTTECIGGMLPADKFILCQDNEETIVTNNNMFDRLFATSPDSLVDI